MREKESIPADEWLFRAILLDWMNGNLLLPEAVEVPRCSFSREKFMASREDVFLLVTNPALNGIAKVQTRYLPDPFDHPDWSNPKEKTPRWEFLAEDFPAEGHAHCEVRLRRVGESFADRVKSSRVREFAKLRLAGALQVERLPR